MKLSTDNILSWSKNYANWLPAIQWSGWLLITVILAKLFWVVTLHITGSDVSQQTISVNSQLSLSQSRKSTDVSGLVSRHLFGNAEVAPVVENVVEEVEVETRLNLKLKGTYAADNQSHSNSIIEDDKGKQAVYFIDDKLKVSGRVFLRQVYSDRIILETNGRREVLRLQDDVPQLEKAKGNELVSKSKNSKRVDDKRKNQQISQSLNKYRKQLLDDPLSLAGVIKYQPKMVNGQMIGITISPGKDKRLFTQLGLRARDVVTSINGVDLSNPQNALQLMSDIQNMHELEVSINRGNETINLLLNLNDKVGI